MNAATVLSLISDAQSRILEELNSKYCFVPVNGKPVIISHDDFDGRRVPAFSRPNDLREILKSKKVMVTVEGKTRQKNQGDWCLNIRGASNAADSRLNPAFRRTFLTGG